MFKKTFILAFWLNVSLVFFLPLVSVAQLPGVLDVSFNGDGKAFAFPVNNSNPVFNFNRASSVFAFGNRIYVVGTSNDEFGGDYAGVAAFDLQGNLDPTFGGDGLVIVDAGDGEYVTDVIVQSDGKIILGGFDNNDFLIIRLNTNGNLDSSWDGDGIVKADLTGNWERITRLRLQSDGKVICAGYSGTNVNDITVARFTSSGTLDKSFGINGVLNSDLQTNSADRIEGVEILNDDQILLVGGTDSNGFVVKLTKDGVPDADFRNGGKFVLNEMYSQLSGLAIQPDGKIIVSGTRGQAKGGIYRFESDGSIDEEFGDDGFADPGVMMWSCGVSYHKKNKIVMFGYSYGEPSRDFAAVSFEINGTLDGCFGTNGVFRTDVGNTTEDYEQTGFIQADGKILLTGQVGLDEKFSVIRVTAPTLSIDRGINVAKRTFTATDAGAAYQWWDCKKNQLVQGQSGRFFTSPTSGTYKALLTKEGCTVSTDCFKTKELFEDVVDNTLNSAKAPTMGSAWADFNNDGNEDLLTVNYAGYANILLTNNGDKTFSKTVNGEVVADNQDSFGSAWGDYDNDGNIDLFVSNNSGTNALYHNLGNGSFEKIETGIIVSEVTESWDCGWIDFDNDGFLDVFIATNDKNFLYKGDGTGQFQKVTKGNIVNDGEASFGFAWGDFNNDGFVDLFIANFGGQNNSLYKNLGNGTFLKIMVGSIVNDGGQSRSASWGDYNNDGFLDLFVTNSGEKPFLYKNNGNETFTKITNDPIVNLSSWAFSATWTDYDNDGYLDMAIVRSTDTDSVALFRNNNNGTFTRVLDAPLVATGTSSWSISPADFDNDGDEDLYIAGRGFNRGYLFENKQEDYAYLGIKLNGLFSNRSGIGARIRVKSNGVWQTKHVSTRTGRGSQGSLRQTFGMKNAQLADSVVVFWPGNKRQILTNVFINQIRVIDECLPYSLNIIKSICDGEAFKFGDRLLKTSGVYKGNYISKLGCDSVVTLNLKVNPIYNLTASQAICDGSSYKFGSQILTTQGIYKEVFKSQYGCDSVVVLTLSINPRYNVNVSRIICEGDSFQFGNQSFASAGKYTALFISRLGCDSTVNLTLVVNPQSRTSLFGSICDGESYSFAGKDLNISGDYLNVLKNVNGCDSTITLHLQVNPSYRVSAEKTICKGEVYNFNGNLLSEDGVYTSTFKSISGCDSIVSLNLSITTFNNVVTQKGNVLKAAEPDAVYQWKECLNDRVNPIADAVSQSFEPLKTGIYSVAITKSGCTIASDCKDFVVTGIENSLTEEVVYPNPVRSILRINIGEKYHFVVVKIISSGGVEVDQLTYNNVESIDYSTDKLSAGIYLLDILLNNSINIRRKFIKE